MSSKAFDTFVGHFVSLIVKNMKGSGKKISNLALAGYFLDEDDVFYYIGETPMEVTAAIAKSDVCAILLGENESNIIDERDIQ